MRVGSWPGPSYDHNPMVRILCGGLTAIGVDVVDVNHPADIKPGSLDVLQLHWAEQIFWSARSAPMAALGAARTISALMRHKAAGTRIAWMVHNLQPHGMRRTERLIWPVLRRAFSRLSDRLITLSADTSPIVELSYRLPPGTVQSVRHPRYSGGFKQEDARRRLGFDRNRKLLVFFGALRENKGLGEVIRAFRELDDRSARLHLLGKASDPDAITALTASDPRIWTDFRYVPREVIALHVSAADAVLAPVGRQLHSGSLVDALSLGAPVITPSTPFSRSLQRDVGTQWLSLTEEPLRAQDLRFARPAGSPNLASYEPEVIARALVSIYDQIS